MNKIELMVGEQGLVSFNRRLAQVISENQRKEKEFDQWLENIKNRTNP